MDNPYKVPAPVSPGEAQNNIFNKLLSEEILAVLQYKMMEHWAKHYRYGKLVTFIKQIRLQEEEHIDELTEKAFELGFLINYEVSKTPVEDSGEVIVSNIDAEEIIEKLVALEKAACSSYTEALETETAKNNPTVADLFKHILAEEEVHTADAVAEMMKIEKLGDDDWLTTLVEHKEPKGFRMPKENAISTSNKKLLNVFMKRENSWGKYQY